MIATTNFAGYYFGASTAAAAGALSVAAAAAALAHAFYSARAFYRLRWVMAG